MSFLKNLNWRYATKKFDISKKVSEKDKNQILEAIRMAPSSYGFQPFHVHIVENKNIREELKKAGYSQPQITNASFLLVFSARIDLDKVVDGYVKLLKESNNEKAKWDGWEGTKTSLSGMSEAERKAWSAKQSYIALGFGLAACAEINIDACPMEGFNPDEFKKILKMPENLYPQALMAVGYRSSDDVPPNPKIRYSKNYLFTEV